MTEVTGVGAVNVLEAVRIVNAKIRFYQASTNEMSDSRTHQGINAGVAPWKLCQRSVISFIKVTPG